MVPGIVTAAAAPPVDSKYAPDTANRRAYAQTERSANDRADRSCRASALAHSFPATLLTAAENALGMRQMGRCEQRQCGRRNCQIQLDGSAVG